MDLAAALLEVGTGRAAASFTLFAQTLDPQWIAQALQATGTASVRRRKLPAAGIGPDTQPSVRKERAELREQPAQQPSNAPGRRPPARPQPRGHHVLDGLRVELHRG